MIYIREENKNQLIYFLSLIDREKEKYENWTEIAKKYDDKFDLFNCFECKETLNSDLTLIKIESKYDNKTLVLESIDYFFRKYHRN